MGVDLRTEVKRTASAVGWNWFAWNPSEQRAAAEALQRAGGMSRTLVACTRHPRCWLANGHRGPHEEIINGKSVPVSHRVATEPLTPRDSAPLDTPPRA